MKFLKIEDKEGFQIFINVDQINQIIYNNSRPEYPSITVILNNNNFYRINKTLEEFAKLEIEAVELFKNVI